MFPCSGESAKVLLFNTLREKKRCPAIPGAFHQLVIDSRFDPFVDTFPTKLLKEPFGQK